MPRVSGLVDALRALLPDRELPADIEARLSAAAATWPGVSVEPEIFACAIAERLGPGEVAAALAALHLDELYLACACAAGLPAALDAFESLCGPVIASAIARTGVPAADRGDVSQIVRRRLLVAASSDQPARIAGYAARGSLASWVRVVAVREAARLMVREPHGRAADEDALERLVASGDDPELAYMKRLYREELRRAFAVAIDALGERERLLLRQHLIDRLGIDQLAALHGVHRSTAARWIEGARAELAAGTQRELLRHLKIDRAELESIVRLIASQVDVSVTRLLG
jgi:RNA polymerase sigma-70 factor (ECF subfamily)